MAWCVLLSTHMEIKKYKLKTLIYSPLTLLLALSLSVSGCRVSSGQTAENTNKLRGNPLPSCTQISSASGVDECVSSLGAAVLFAIPFVAHWIGDQQIEQQIKVDLGLYHREMRRKPDEAKRYFRATITTNTNNKITHRYWYW